MLPALVRPRFATRAFADVPRPTAVDHLLPALRRQMPSRSAFSGGVSHHRARMSMLLDEDEASRLVEAARGVVLGDAETQGSASLGNAGFDQSDEEPSSDPLVSTRGDDCNGQFVHILGYEHIRVSG